jgi:hypothetical protein
MIKDKGGLCATAEAFVYVAMTRPMMFFRAFQAAIAVEMLLAIAACISRYTFSILPRVAPYCVPSGVNITLVSRLRTAPKYAGTIEVELRLVVD